MTIRAGKVMTKTTMINKTPMPALAIVADPGLVAKACAV